MTNLAITANCNRNCSYCFAKGLSSTVRNMSRKTFISCLLRLQHSGISQVRLLGGEPSLHPEFTWMVRESLAWGFTVYVFSNGLFGRKHLTMLAALPQEKVELLVNCHPFEELASGEARLLERTLDCLGPRVTPGYNIHNPGVDLSFIFDLIDAKGLKKRLRLGLAHPGPGGSNRSLHPKHYPMVGGAVASFTEAARARGVQLCLDCGFVPCMFPPEFLDSYPELAKDTGTCCGPIPDILPDGNVIACFALREENVLLWRDEEGRDLIIERFNNLTRGYRAAGIYKHCASCHFFMQRRCDGGCLAAVIKRFEQQKPLKYSRIEVNSESVAGHQASVDGDDEYAPLCIPYIDQPPGFWQELSQDWKEKVAEVYLPFPDNAISTGRPLQPDNHLKAFLDTAVIPSALLLNGIVRQEPEEKYYLRIYETLSGLTGRYEISSVTLTDLRIAERLRCDFPELQLVASTLMEIATPHQAELLNSHFHVLVPSTSILRDLRALKAIREAFEGRIRLLVNEGCLPGCIFRTQHFYEMGNSGKMPQSLCAELLQRQPWRRLTGSWILPQHLHLYQGLWDELKLAGRVTLNNPEDYRRVLACYATGAPLSPDQIGGGPAAPVKAQQIPEKFFLHTLSCDRMCHQCDLCQRVSEQ